MAINFPDNRDQLVPPPPSGDIQTGDVYVYQGTTYTATVLNNGAVRWDAAVSAGSDAYVLKVGDTMTGQLTLPGGGTGSEAATVDQIPAALWQRDNNASRLTPATAGDSVAVVNADQAVFTVGEGLDGSGSNHLGVYYGDQITGTDSADLFTSNGDLRIRTDGNGVVDTAVVRFISGFTGNDGTVQIAPSTGNITTTGDLSAAAGTFSDDVKIGTATNLGNADNFWFESTANGGSAKVTGVLTGSAFASYYVSGGTGHHFTGQYDNTPNFQIDHLGNTEIGGDIANDSPNITLNANGDISNFFPSGNPFCTIKASTKKLTLNGTVADGMNSGTIVFATSWAGSEAIQLAAGGTANKPGGGSWGTTSDKRVKEGIADYATSLAELRQLTPRSYRYIGNPNTYIGLVAQEAEAAMPELVTKGEGKLPDGTEVDDFRHLDQTPLTFALINAVKEMATRIEALEAEVQSLKGGSN